MKFYTWAADLCFSFQGATEMVRPYEVTIRTADVPHSNIGGEHYTMDIFGTNSALPSIRVTAIGRAASKTYTVMGRSVVRTDEGHLACL